MEGSKTPEQAIAHKRSFDEQQDEDSATMKASEDLKHTRISDKEPTEGEASKDEAGIAKPLSDKGDHTSGFTKETTPERSTRSGGEDDGMMEQISSPKKKRVRELDDETKESEGVDKINKERVPSNGSATSADRSDRLEPEKKRHRDTLEGGAEAAGVTASQGKQATNGDEGSKTADKKPNGDETESDKRLQKGEGDTSTGMPQTSPSAFASSGFGALAASGTSGFGELASKPSIFGGGSATTASPFGGNLKGESAANKSTNEPKAGETGSTFGGAFGGGSTTGFGGQASGGFGGGFGSALSGGFGGGFGGGFAASQSNTLSTFGSANPDTAKAGKPAKAFGAPESDEEEESGDDGDAEGDVGSDGEDESSTYEDKKRPKLTKVPIHDGEEDEVTLSQFRAKLFAMESKEEGWKERGVGNLKVNAHKSCVEFDDYTGALVPGSFDVSLRNDEDGPPVIAARLVMRQENTHRVILNTIINRALKLEEKPSNAAGKGYMFTAFDGSKPVNMLLKMNENNARLFISEVSAVQSGLL